MAKDDKPKKAEQSATDDAITPHPLVKKLQPELTSHKHLVTLTGYPGDSTVAGNFRLYLDRDFQSYYEIDRDDVVHHWPSVAGDDNAPLHVAIEADAKPHLVVNTRVSSAAAGFLKGELVSTFLTGAIESASAASSVGKTPPPPPPHGDRPFRRGRRWNEDPE